jgi:hypothetical protein
VYKRQLLVCVTFTLIFKVETINNLKSSQRIANSVKVKIFSWQYS